MSQDKTLTPYAIALRILGAVAIVVAAALLGLLFGKLSAPDLLPGNLTGLPDGAKVPEADTETGVGTPDAAPDAPREPPPILLHLGIEPDSPWDVLDSEVAYAAAIGVHQYMIPAILPWGEDIPTAATTEAMARIVQSDPDANFLLQVNFNPPATWFDAHPDARMAGTVGDTPYPSPTSPVWLDACRAAFDRLQGALADTDLASRVAGYALYGLVSDSWQRGAGADDTEAGTAAFREWLSRAYKDDAALRKAWGNAESTLASATVPTSATGEPSPAVFQDLATAQPLVDYRRFAAESVADAIGALSAYIRERNAETTVWANYGHTFERANPAYGHLALSALLESDVYGFISTVSILNRGIGDTGGFMGPVDSARAHGKQWMLVDDTRTGIAWSPDSGQIEQIRGLRAEDVHNVQRRNFAMAAIHGLNLAWSDPNGEGFLYDDRQWEVFGQLYEIYQKYGNTPENALRAGGDVNLPAGLGVQAQHPMVQVIIDERSQFLTRAEAGLDALLAANRDALLNSGASTAFGLLDDLLESRLPASPVYVFLNAYRIPASDVKTLHARFAEEQATAIWVYAPGYLDVTMNKNNVRDTVAMNIRQFEEPSPAGSVYTLGGGHWIEQGQTFGEARLIDPLFYIDEPEADVLATFQQTEKPSVAIRTLEEGWTSVFIAEPRLSAPLLREILRILEQPVYFRPGKERLLDAAFINPRLVAIHAAESGERIVNLGAFYDIVDLFDASIGWPQKESFVLNVKKGETRLFHLTVP